MASIGAVFLPVHSVVTILCYKVLNMMIQDPLPEVSLFSQLATSLTNKILVHDSQASTPLWRYGNGKSTGMGSVYAGYCVCVREASMSLESQ